MKENGIDYMFDSLTGGGKLLTVILQAAGGDDISDKTMQELTDLMLPHFSGGEAKALVVFAQNVSQSIKFFMKYYEECYRSTSTAVEGSDTVN